MNAKMKLGLALLAPALLLGLIVNPEFIVWMIVFILAIYGIVTFLVGLAEGE
jgi:hypothetical protein